MAIIFLNTLACAANLVVNPGFETGDFSGWTVNDGWGFGWTVNDAIGEQIPYDGAWFASNGCVGAQCIGSSTGGDTSPDTSYLYQDIATVPGASYTVGFEFASAGPPMQLVVTFGDNVIANLVNEPSSYTYTEYSGSIIADSAVTRLEFQGRQDPGWDALDNISVAETYATPEPTTMVPAVLVVAGLLVAFLKLGVIHLRRA